MGTIFFIFFLVIILIILSIIVYTLKNAKENSPFPELPYRCKHYFFTRSEQQFFHILQNQLDNSRFVIFPKVRLADFVEVDTPKTDRQQYWNRIKAKHVDFLIYDLNKGCVVHAIELDGYSHNNHSVKKSDDFKDNLYHVIEIPLTRVRVGTNFEQEVQNIITGL